MRLLQLLYKIIIYKVKLDFGLYLTISDPFQNSVFSNFESFCLFFTGLILGSFLTISSL